MFDGGLNVGDGDGEHTPSGGATKMLKYRATLAKAGAVARLYDVVVDRGEHAPRHTPCVYLTADEFTFTGEMTGRQSATGDSIVVISADANDIHLACSHAVERENLELDDISDVENRFHTLDVIPTNRLDEMADVLSKQPAALSPTELAVIRNSKAANADTTLLGNEVNRLLRMLAHKLKPDHHLLMGSCVLSLNAVADLVRDAGDILAADFDANRRWLAQQRKAAKRLGLI